MGLMSVKLPRVVIAISAYRSDNQVLQLLTNIFVEIQIEVAGVIVIDSLSDGSLERAIRDKGWPVRYENADLNLGSAGNLARRLALAATYDADWCFTINHDGMIDSELIEILAAKANRHSRVGAVYPARTWIDRAQTVLEPHTHVFRAPRHSATDIGTSTDEVAWDSSNGALYGLAPVRAGIHVWSDLWYGWEDLAYGWQLDQAGWKQYYCRDAMYFDDYEYEKVSLFGRQIYITRKPTWTAYYIVRNLVLIVRRTGISAKGCIFLVERLAREMMLTILYRSSKAERLGLIFKGLVDGLAGRTGKRTLP